MIPKEMTLKKLQKLEQPVEFYNFHDMFEFYFINRDYIRDYEYDKINNLYYLTFELKSMSEEE